MEPRRMEKRRGDSLELTACLALVVSVLLLITIPSHAAEGRGSKSAPFVSSRICAQCHKEVYDYWSKSMHSMSVADPVFQTAYLEAYKISEGKAKFSCSRCHAPTTLLTEDYGMESDLSKEGVTCDFCHSVKGVELGSKPASFELEAGGAKRGPLYQGSKAARGHKVEYSQLHTAAEFCAGCHEYKNEKGALILGTYSEWKRGPYAQEGKPCQFCHMQEVPRKIKESEEDGGSRSAINRHDVAGGHSVQMLKEAIEVKIVEVRREGDKVRVTVDVTNKGSGHMVPTGIPRRTLVLNVSLTTDRGLVLTNQRVYRKTMLDEEGKELTTDAATFIKSASIASDNRLAPRETRREPFLFYIPRGKPVEAKASVTYLYKPLLLEEGRIEVEMSSDTARVAK